MEFKETLTEAVHENNEMDSPVMRFISHDHLNEETLNLINNGDLYGLFYDENENILAQDKGMEEPFPALK